jgi:hypothetical protein
LYPLWFIISKRKESDKYSNFLLKKKIRELKNSILWQHEPVCKAFVLGAKDSPADADTS